MIKVKGRRIFFTGKDLKWVKTYSKELGLSMKTFVHGCLWEMLMREARNGKFKKNKKGLAS